MHLVTDEFNLLSLPDFSVTADQTPDFTWEVPDDPNGDPISYYFYYTVRDLKSTPIRRLIRRFYCEKVTKILKKAGKLFCTVFLEVYGGFFLTNAGGDGTMCWRFLCWIVFFGFQGQCYGAIGFWEC